MEKPIATSNTMMVVSKTKIYRVNVTSKELINIGEKNKTLFYTYSIMKNIFNLKGTLSDEDGKYVYNYTFSWLAPQEGIAGFTVARGLGESEDACGMFGALMLVSNNNGEIIKRVEECSNRIVNKG